VGSRRYRLVVEGELSDRFAFEGMTLTYEDGNTVLTGPVRDQSELQGLLQHAAALGLTLLGFAAIDEVGGPAAAAVAENLGHERVGVNKSKGR
jgi:hypothetical protein